MKTDSPAPQESPNADEHPDLSAQYGRFGLWLFALYLALYAGFVGLSAFAPQAMSRTPFLGVNIAVLYGLGLIVAAIVLALFYTLICRLAGDRHAAKGGRR